MADVVCCFNIFAARRLFIPRIMYDEFTEQSKLYAPTIMSMLNWYLLNYIRYAGLNTCIIKGPTRLCIFN